MYENVNWSATNLAKMQPIFDLVREPLWIVERRTQTIVAANSAAREVMTRAGDTWCGLAWTDVAQQVGPATALELDDNWLAMVAECAAVAASPVIGDAQRDALTGLASRDALWARGGMASGPNSADESPGRDAPSRGRRALLFIDLDGFKQVNDTWGHVWGDRVLRALAERLSDCVRPGDLVVRYGGDEFVVLVEGVRRQRDLERLARRICRSIERPLVVDRHEVAVSASIGIARSSRRDQSIEELVAEADRAMYRAKSERQRRTGEGAAMAAAVSP